MKRYEGFGLVYILILLAVVAAAGIGSYVYSKDKDSSSAIKNTSSKNEPEGQVSPYEGWASAVLKYEMLSLKYAQGWKIINTSKINGVTGTVSPGSDQVKLTAPSGLLVTVSTGVTGIGNGFGNILSSEPINTMGGNYYLLFYTNNSNSTANAQGACVGTTPRTPATYPLSKNIELSSGSNSSVYNVVCLSYPEDSNGDVPEKSVATFKSDTSYNDVKLIIQSLKY